MLGIARTSLIACVLAAVVAVAGEPQPPLPLEAFTGFGLGDFQGEGSIAAALRTAQGDRQDDDEPLLPGVEFCGLSVQGPSGRNSELPIAAEVRSRIDRFDVAAGLQTQPERFEEGPSQWVGRIGLTSERSDGSERFELRTTLGRWSDGGLLGLEVGPRLERRLHRGATFFIDGKAQAQAARSIDDGWWTLPGMARDGSGMVGVTAHTGVTR